jgi:hypothetical protein
MAKRREKRERRSVVVEPDAMASISERRRFMSRYPRIGTRSLRAGSAASPATAPSRAASRLGLSNLAQPA